MRHFSLTPGRRGELPIFRAPPLDELGVDAFVTARAGGVSRAPYDSLNVGDHVGDDADAVAENRARLARALGLETLPLARQVHGTALVHATNLQTGDETPADVVWTDSASPAIVLVADCVPVILADPTSHRLVVVHAGWRGLAHGVLDTALGVLSPATTRAVIGPSISGATYQVGPEVVNAHAVLSRHATPDVADRSLLDLRGAAVDWLVHGGVSTSEIYVSREVTDGGGTFFSDRAERPCGRFAVAARWT